MSSSTLQLGNEKLRNWLNENKNIEYVVEPLNLLIKCNVCALNEFENCSKALWRFQSSDKKFYACKFCLEWCKNNFSKLIVRTLEKRYSSFMRCDECCKTDKNDSTIKFYEIDQLISSEFYSRRKILCDNCLVKIKSH